MAITLKLNPELEAHLVAQARASGMTVDAYLVSVVEGAVLPLAHHALSPEKRASAFEMWSANHRSSTPLSDYSISRDGMYEGLDR